MRELIADTETDGLLPNMTTMHSLVLRDAALDGQIVASCASIAGEPVAGFAPISEGLRIMESADLIIGHNMIGYDDPAIRKMYPSFKMPKMFDTMVAAAVIWPSDRLREIDFKLLKAGKIPAKLIGRQALEAWGHRLGNFKGDYKQWCADNGIEEPFAIWRPELQSYCEQDTSTTLSLYQSILRQKWPQSSLDLEMAVAPIIARQERRGVAFNRTKAEALEGKLRVRYSVLEQELASAFPPWEVRTPFTPKASNKTKGWVKGVPTEKVKTIIFNPASRDHIANRLITLYGWVPEEYTKPPKGGAPKPKIDEKSLTGMDFPCAPVLREYLMLGKRLGQLADGKEALLKHLKPDGRIYGRVYQNGAVTGRMAHATPNNANVPKPGTPYGEEFRECYEAAFGYVLCGIDADALELCCLAGYMARYDLGAYVKTVLEGKKEDGTDIHSVNARALGLDPVKKYAVEGKMVSGREIAKVWFYAFIYGAGDAKLGFILGVLGAGAPAAGKASRARFLKKLPALKKLADTIKERLKVRKYLLGLDGRLMFARSAHSSLNTVLQSAGAILMKKALVLLDAALQLHGFVPGVDYEFVLNVHDEWQIECRREIAGVIGEYGKTAIKDAGKAFRFQCPLAGSAKVGANWRETH